MLKICFSALLIFQAIVKPAESGVTKFSFNKKALNQENQIDFINKSMKKVKKNSIAIYQDADTRQDEIIDESNITNSSVSDCFMSNETAHSSIFIPKNANFERKPKKKATKYFNATPRNDKTTSNIIDSHCVSNDQEEIANNQFLRRSYSATAYSHFQPLSRSQKRNSNSFEYSSQVKNIKHFTSYKPDSSSTPLFTYERKIPYQNNNFLPKKEPANEKLTRSNYQKKNQSVINYDSFEVIFVDFLIHNFDGGHLIASQHTVNYDDIYDAQNRIHIKFENKIQKKKILFFPRYEQKTFRISNDIDNNWEYSISTKCEESLQVNHKKSKLSQKLKRIMSLKCTNKHFKNVSEPKLTRSYTFHDNHRTVKNDEFNFKCKDNENMLQYTDKKDCSSNNIYANEHRFRRCFSLNNYRNNDIKVDEYSSKNKNKIIAFNQNESNTPKLSDLILRTSKHEIETDSNSASSSHSVRYNPKNDYSKNEIVIQRHFAKIHNISSNQCDENSDITCSHNFLDIPQQITTESMNTISINCDEYHGVRKEMNNDEDSMSVNLRRKLSRSKFGRGFNRLRKSIRSHVSPYTTNKKDERHETYETTCTLDNFDQSESDNHMRLNSSKSGKKFKKWFSFKK